MLHIQYLEVKTERGKSAEQKTWICGSHFWVKAAMSLPKCPRTGSWWGWALPSWHWELVGVRNRSSGNWEAQGPWFAAWAVFTFSLPLCFSCIHKTALCLIFFLCCSCAISLCVHERRIGLFKWQPNLGLNSLTLLPFQFWTHSSIGGSLGLTLPKQFRCNVLSPTPLTWHTTACSTMAPRARWEFHSRPWAAQTGVLCSSVRCQNLYTESEVCFCLWNFSSEEEISRNEYKIL